MKINDLHIDLFAHFKFRSDSQSIKPISLNTTEHVETDNTVHVYKFTPETTAIYKLYTLNKPTDDTQIFIDLEDENRNSYTKAEIVDPDNAQGDVSLSYELQAGTTYYFYMREMNSGSTSFDFVLSEANLVNVTFHTSRAGTYFDDDAEKKEKTISLTEGQEIEFYLGSGLTVEDDDHLAICGG